MFRPRHAYKSPITNRFRGRAKGCPVFNNLIDINSNMVEQHDECLECLAKMKNKTDLYRTLADSNKPSNQVIKSLQRLSSSASNNRLKTCLQFLIIKVNEKSLATPKQTKVPATTTSTTTTIAGGSPASIHNDAKDASSEYSPNEQVATTPTAQTAKHLTKRRKLHNHKQQQLQKQKHNQLASPPQDQVSSTQDQVAPSQDDHDCQTSPMMLVTTHIDETNHDDHLYEKMINDDSPIGEKEGEEHKFTTARISQSSPPMNCQLSSSTTTSTATTTTTTSASPYKTIDTADGSAIQIRSEPKGKQHNDDVKVQSEHDPTPIRRQHVFRRKKTHNSTNINSDHETSPVTSWSPGSGGLSISPPSATSSAASTSSISSLSSDDSSSSSSCSSSLSPSPLRSPLSSPDIINELKGPRLKLSEEKIRKIKKRPVLIEDMFYASERASSASTPTVTSGSSPGQHSSTTQNSDQSTSTSSIRSFGFASNMSIHTFQAPPTFVNNLKPCNLPVKAQEIPPSSTPPVTTKVEMLNCAICGIKDKPPNLSKIYGQNSCLLCTKFFGAFLKRPQQLYCAQDGDCLMTFDSRCQACWIKICLQKFDIEEEHRKIGQKYSPKLLSSPNVSLITIDTSVAR